MNKEAIKQMFGRISKIFFPVIALIAVIFAGYFYMQWNKLQQNPQQIAQEEAADLVAKISKLMILPTDEEPTVATVSDPELLKDQAFFANAKKGDKVLIYTNAKKAILYSVTLNKIIDIAPLNIGTQKAVTPPVTTGTNTDTNTTTDANNP